MSGTGGDRAEVTALLSRVGFGETPRRIELLQGGYLNQVCLVETGTRKLVLKRFADPIEGTLFPNLPKDEAGAAERLDGLNVAPVLAGFWPDEGAMASEFIEGGTWDEDMAAVAALLLRKEVADPEGFRQVPLTPEAILAEGDALFARTSLPRPVRPSPFDLPPLSRRSLIHTDIGASNLIGRGEALRLIDWQCPAAGDLCEDIYSFLSPAFQILSQRAPFTAPERQRFFDALGLPETEARYQLLEPFYAWRIAGYCALRAETHPEAEVRARYLRALRAETSLVES